MARMMERIEDLRHDAETDGDPFSEASVNDLIELVTALGGHEPDAVWGSDDGHLRVMWRDAGGRLSIDLHGGQRFDFVHTTSNGGGAWSGSGAAAISTVRSLLARNPGDAPAPTPAAAARQED